MTDGKSETISFKVTVPRGISPTRWASYATEYLPVFFHKITASGDSKDHRRMLNVLATDPEFSRKKLVRIAFRILDEENFGSFIKELPRHMNRDKAVGEYIDKTICYFWNGAPVLDPSWAQLPGLNRWAQRPASVCVSFHLHQRGIHYKLSHEAYGKRVKRLRQMGATLELTRPLLVVRGELTREGKLSIVRKSDKTRVPVLSGEQLTLTRFNAANGSGEIAKPNRSRVWRTRAA